MTTIPRPRRSALYMPATNARAIAKARTLSVDVVILDLEDAVTPEAKVDARHQAVEAIREGDFGDREVVIRVNAADTEWGADDMFAAVAARPAAILVPKVASPADIGGCQPYLERAEGGIALWAMIETCRAILDIAAIAACAETTALSCLVMGTNDLGKEIGIAPDPDAPILRQALAQTVIAARAHGLTALDGVSNQFEDQAAFTAACAAGAALGFDGKTLIHPKQVDICNRAFSPSRDQITEAQAIVAAFALPENAGKGAIKLDGRMIELLHLQQAQATLAKAITASARA